MERAFLSDLLPDGDEGRARCEWLLPALFLRSGQAPAQASVRAAKVARYQRAVIVLARVLVERRRLLRLAGNQSVSGLPQRYCLPLKVQNRELADPSFQ